MQLAETRHVRFVGTSVEVAPKTDEEARAALKELRHKKKELGWVRRTLTKQKRAAEQRKARASRPKRRGTSLIARLRGWLSKVMAGPRFFARYRANVDIAAVSRQCEQIDEILHNIDSVILQVEGKLLHSTGR